MGKKVVIIYENEDVFEVHYQVFDNKPPEIYKMDYGTVSLSEGVDLFEPFPWYNNIFKEQFNTITDYCSSLIVIANDKKSSLRMISRKDMGSRMIIEIDTIGKGLRLDSPKNIYDIFRKLAKSKSTSHTEDNNLSITIHHSNIDNIIPLYWVQKIISEMEATMENFIKEKHK